MVPAARSRTRLALASRAVCAVCAAIAAVVAAQLLTPGGAPAQEPGDFAYSFAIADAIDRRTERELKRGLEDAKKQDAAVVIIRLDTPGGQGSSMRAMVRDIVAAPMPVIVYVHPSGGHAESAGVFLTLAGDVAAMAPATNIGSATPVLGGPPARGEAEERLLRDLRRKVLNDGVALARALAEDHGRNADLAERTIRDATNVSAVRARRERLVDVLAPTEEALLRALDGFAVKGRKAQRLRTAGLQIRRVSVGSTAVAVTEGGDESSLLRSFAYVFGTVGGAVLVAGALGRARRPWRRWRRRRRRRRLMQKKSAQVPHDSS